MKHVKLFEDFSSDTIKLVALYDDDGNKIEKSGYVEEGVGIFDDDGDEYPAGETVDGEIYGSQVDSDNTIFKIYSDGKVPGIKIS